jgi:hypothetical protein
MVRPERFELPTYWFVASRSIQLSYGRPVANELLASHPHRHSARRKAASDVYRRATATAMALWSVCIIAAKPGKSIERLRAVRQRPLRARMDLDDEAVRANRHRRA